MVSAMKRSMLWSILALAIVVSGALVGALCQPAAAADSAAAAQSAAETVDSLIRDLRAISHNISGLPEPMRKLEEIGAPAVGPLLALLKENDYAVQRVAVQTLGRIGDRRAVKPLILLLKRQNTPEEDRMQANSMSRRLSSYVREWSAIALGQIGDPAHSIRWSRP